MKKNRKKNQDQTETPRRLRLVRETILVLRDPALLEQARGGRPADSTVAQTTTYEICD